MPVPDTYEELDRLPAALACSFQQGRDPRTPSKVALGEQGTVASPQREAGEEPLAL